MDLLKMRRGSQDHSQWLHKLEAAMELTKWEEWNKESMIVHIFLESADTEMSKLATTMLSKDKVDLSELRIQIRAVENSVWYKPNNNQAKIVQPRNWGNSGVGDGAGDPLEASGVGIVIARPTTQMRAGGSVPIVIDLAINRSSVIRRKR